MATLKYWLWLTGRRGLGNAGALRVLDHFVTPERAFYADPEEYALVEDLTPAARRALLDKDTGGAERILEDCARLDLRIMTLQDADYPERLRQLPDPPLALYIRGRTFAFDEEAAVCMVGAREATPYGIGSAGRLGLELARGGALVVSGMAQGIDTASVQGALKGGGPVVSVLGGGVDVPYPRENRWLYEDVAAAGALISEYPPGTEHRGEHFPVRNRLISGLSLGVVAVECARFSGTMKTIEHAMDQDRDIFAVPGNIDAPRSEGPNWLLRQGARPVTCAQDILEEYWLRFPQKLARSAPLPPEAAQQRLEQLRSRKGPEETGPEEEREEAPASASPREDGASDLERVPQGEQRSRFTDDQLTLLRAMAGRRKPSTADELVEETQIPARRVLSALTMLQVDGAVREHPGKRFSPLVELEG